MNALDRRLMDRIPGVRRMLVADSVLALLAAGAVLAQAILIATIASRAFLGETVAYLSPEIVALLAVIGVRAAATWGFEAVGRLAASRVMSELRTELLRARLLLGGRRTEAAEIGSTAVDGVDAVEALFARYVPQMVLAVLVPIAVLILVADLDPISAAIMAVTLPLIPIFMWLVGRFTEVRARERLEALNRLSGYFLDVVRGLPTLRAFNRGDTQAERVGRVSDDYRRATMATLRIAFLSGTILELAATLGIALVAVTVGVRLVDGDIGLEAALTVLLLAPELYLPLRNLGAQFHASADGRAVTDRMLSLIEESEQRGARPTTGGRAAPDPAHRPLRLEGVSFSYPSRDVPVLAGVDLEIAPQETVALTGPSGGGKSTLASILLGLEMPERGRLLVGDEDLAEIDLDDWRRRLAWVPQFPTIFRGSVADNVRIGRPGADDDAVADALRAAVADRFVAGLPDGPATVVGEGGRPLSAGETQRIGLARAFVRDASLVVLDEPTANLDPASAGEIEEAITGLCRDRTALVIAHRLSLAARADRVVSLIDGRIG